MKSKKIIEWFLDSSIENVCRNSKCSRCEFSVIQPPYCCKVKAIAEGWGRPGKTISEKTKSILDDIHQGFPVSDIAKLHNVSRSYIYKLRNKWSDT